MVAALLHHLTKHVMPLMRFAKPAPPYVARRGGGDEDN